MKNAKRSNQTNNPNKIIFTLTKYHKIPGRLLVLDLIRLLLVLVGYNGILVIVDRFSKMTCYILINMNITAQGIAKVS